MKYSKTKFSLIAIFLVVSFGSTIFDGYNAQLNYSHQSSSWSQAFFQPVFIPVFPVYSQNEEIKTSSNKDKKIINLNDLIPSEKQKKNKKSKRSEALDIISSSMIEEAKVDRDRLMMSLGPYFEDKKFFSFEALPDEIKQKIKNLNFFDLNKNRLEPVYIASSKDEITSIKTYNSFIFKGKEEYFSAGVGLILAKLDYEYKILTPKKNPLEIYHRIANPKDDPSRGTTYLIENNNGDIIFLKNMIPSSQFYINHNYMIIDGKKFYGVKDRTIEIINELDKNIKRCDYRDLRFSIKGFDGCKGKNQVISFLEAEILLIIKDDKLYLGTEEQVSRALCG